MIERIDFTSCRRLLGKAYNGANGKKIAVEYEGRQYMLKFPPSGAQKPTDLSYTNSCISEHLGSSIFNMLFVRENGYPKKIGIIAWFDFILHIMRDIVRLHATK